MIDKFYRHQVPISIVILLAGIIWIIISSVFIMGDSVEIKHAPKEGFQAPNFTLDSSTGHKSSLSDFRGKVVLVNFWATWCPPCRKEMPAMQHVFESYQDEGFVIIAINAAYQDSSSKADALIASNGITFPILFDTDGNVANHYHVQAFPTSFFIDREGIIHEIVFGGPMAETLLQTRVVSLLNDGE